MLYSILDIDLGKILSENAIVLVTKLFSKLKRRAWIQKEAKCKHSIVISVKRPAPRWKGCRNTKLEVIQAERKTLVLSELLIKLLSSHATSAKKQAHPKVVCICTRLEIIQVCRISLQSLTRSSCKPRLYCTPLYGSINQIIFIFITNLDSL